MRSKLAVVFMALVFSANAALAAGAWDSGEVFLSLTRSSAIDTERMPSNVSIITREEIEEKNARTLGEALQGEPGIILARSSLGQMESVFIRGSASARRTLFLIDGMRVNSVSTGAADLFAIPAAIIERVEIIRGAGAAVYGASAFGGVVNVITRRATEDSPMLSGGLSFGSFQTFDANIIGAHATDRFDFLLIPSLTSTDGHRPHSEFNSRALFLNTGFNINDTTSLRLTGQAFNADINIPGPASGKFPSSMYEDNKFLTLSLDTLVGEGNLNVSAYVQQNIRDARTWDTKHTNDRIGFGAHYTFLNNLITIGGEYWKDNYDFDNRDAWFPHTFDVSRETVAGFAQLNIEFGNLTLLPTVRFDHNSGFGDFFTPALTAVYNLNENFKFSGNVGRVWSPPTFGQLYDNTDFGWGPMNNPDLKPEEGVSSDIGIAFTNGNLSLAATGFFIESKNFLVPDFSFVNHNIGKARQYGFEFEARQKLTPWLKHSINYTYLRGDNVTDNMTLAFAPMHSGSYTLNINPTYRIRTSATLTYIGEMYVNAANTQKTGDALTVDLRVEYMINQNFSVWLQGLNLGNTQYELFWDQPMPGATVFGGISVRL
ncbi:MAG: TonB-dependent receptor [Elusimicrobia bacterium]|nr:TonB-dependent receptor [Elusimicrobiota bacterium]